ncbi:MAG: hypothetical protein A2V66_15830 [Ignavibacteria bacterium RBG_13_36_8]|nr:MAG: hypothetical protein A2V66_15830 [Ignavibacteria bacterium RBG_13_36_8]
MLLARLKRASSQKESVDKSSLSLLWITIIVSIAVASFVKSTGIGNLKNYIAVIHYGGVVLILIGLIIRWVAILKLKKFFTVNVSIAENHKLIKSGIFKYLRHPSYTGSLLSFIGLGVAFINWMSILIIFIPVLVSFLYRISVEEKVLTQLFGEEYKSYSKSTKKLLPFIY